MPTALVSPFIDNQPPDWASGYGQDHFGFYADWSIVTGDRYWDIVSQRMRWIPGGTFLMGSPGTEPERLGREGPQHEVTLSGFWMAETTCTQELWKAVMNSEPSHFQGVQLPVEQVSHDDAREFCARVNAAVPGLKLGLPTEAQWEYACRAGSTTPFSTGDTITTDQANYDGNFPYGNSERGVDRGETIDVKELPPNPWGLYQMHGNVWEWCHDWYEPYREEPQTDPNGPEGGSHHVVRGGCWNNRALAVRSASRYSRRQANRDDLLGFRCVSSASQGSLPNK